MSGLRELQLAFAATVLRRADPSGAQLQPAGERLARRLTVYRVNARENFAAALESAYPVLRAELGDEEFRSLAWSYQQAQPSRSGNLFEIGRGLPDYLDAALRGTGREYLHDLARLEWAVQEAMVAADAKALPDLRRLASLAECEHAALRFVLHPSVRIVTTTHRVYPLWQAFHAAQPRPPPPAPPIGPEYVLVRRTGEGVELFVLDALEHGCLESLLSGATLGEMTDVALATCDAPDIGRLLARWTTRGVIMELRLPPGGAPA